MRELKKNKILLFIIAFALLYAIIYIVPKVTGAMVSSYTIEYGELKLSDEVTAYIVRNEQVYTAGNGGDVNRYIEDGTLIRRGTTILETTGSTDREPDEKYTEMLARLGNDAVSTDNYTVEDGGIVSYYADGYESKLTPKTMRKGSLEYYSNLSQDNVLDLERNVVVKGEPVFKIVDRTKWYMVCFIDEDHGDRYEIGQKVDVEFDDDTVSAEVYKKAKKDGKIRIILKTDNYYEKFAQTRAAEVSLVTYDERGLIIENSSIGEEKGVPGVYVRNKSNDYYFLPIKVYATDGKYSLVADTTFTDQDNNLQSTVEIYDEILKEAK